MPYWNPSPGLPPPLASHPKDPRLMRLAVPGEECTPVTAVAWGIAVRFADGLTAVVLESELAERPPGRR